MFKDAIKLTVHCQQRRIIIEDALFYQFLKLQEFIEAFGELIDYILQTFGIDFQAHVYHTQDLGKHLFLNFREHCEVSFSYV